LNPPGSGDGDLWLTNEDQEDLAAALPPEVRESATQIVAEGEEKVPGPQQTLERAGNVVLDSDFLTPYAQT
jgi:hypothetical protein